MLSDAFVEVECDACKLEVERIELTALAKSGSWDERNVESRLKRLGWQTAGDSHICPECQDVDDTDDDSWPNDDIPFV